MPTVFPLDPNADLDFGFDWSNWLATGETISDSSWTLIPATGLIQHTDTYSNTIATVWLKEIVAGATHRITNSITTSDARKEDRSFYVKGIER
jgi:hypothetical protein